MNKTFSTKRPNLLLDFVNSKQASPALEYVCETPVLFTDSGGRLVEAPINQPVLEYVNGRSAGLKLWGAITNLCPTPTSNSGLIGMEIKQNHESTLSPDGLDQVPLFTETTNGTRTEHRGGDFKGDITEGTHVWSAFFKFPSDSQDRRAVLRVGHHASPYRIYAGFKRLNGQWVTDTTSTNDATHEVFSGIDNLSNGWGRAWLRFTMPVAQSNYTFRTEMHKPDRVDPRQYLGESDVGFYVWGRQLTKSDNQAPYIKTNGVATSIAGAFPKIPSITLNPTEGAFIAEYVQPCSGSMRHVAGFVDDQNSAFLIAGIDDAGIPRLRSANPNATLYSSYGAPKPGEIVKYGISFNFITGKFAIAINGVVDEVTYNLTPYAQPMHLRPGWGTSENSNLGSHLRRIACYNSSLSREELAALTS